MSRLARRRVAHPPAPFVVGVGRSGTTLLRLMLDAHPQLAIPPETHFVPTVIERGREGATADELVAEITGARGWNDFGVGLGPLRERVAALDRADPAGVLRAFFGLYAQRHGKPRWGDKTPIYVKRMQTIAGVLPEARFVHLIRDGRDVALSRRKRGMGAGKPIADTAGLWRRRIEDARRQARRLRGRYLELRYEDLVAGPESGLRCICDLIELEFDPAMLSHHDRAGDRLAELGDLTGDDRGQARAGAERKAAHALASRPPTGGRTEVWREEMDPAERDEFERVAGKLLAELGYEVAG